MLTVGAVVLVVAIGLVVLILGEPLAEEWVTSYEVRINRMSHEELLRTFRELALLAAAGAFLPMALMAAVFFYQAFRVARSGRFPYPGMWILRDMPLETGHAAARRRRRLNLLGAGLLLAGVLVAGLMVRTLLGLIESG